MSRGDYFFVVDFAENYTFEAQKEIQSEYYHFDQVSIFIHVLYRHAHVIMYNLVHKGTSIYIHIQISNLFN